MKKRHLIFLILTLTLIVIDTIFVVANHRALDQELEQQISTEAAQLEAAFNTVLDQTYSNLLTIATFVANDLQAQRLFLQGARAVVEEGGGAGGAKADEARKALYALLADNWVEVQANFATRQLHYHLGPGSTSFLRVHRPEKFGDNMDEVRYTIVDTNAEKTPRSGFETGRVYSGLRGVVPVYADDPETQQEVFVGALEAGTSFDRVLEVIESNYAVNAAVLLTKDHVNANMWPEAIDDVFDLQIESCDCVVEATTSNQVESVVNAMIEAGFSEPGEHTGVLPVNANPTLISTLMIRDYRGSRNPELPAAGRIIFWHDAGYLVDDIQAAKRFNLVFALFGFILVETLIFFGLKFALRRLEDEVELRVDEVRRSEHRLHRAQDIAGLGIWDWAASGNKILVSEHGHQMLSLRGEGGESTLEEVLERVHPDDRSRVKAAMREAVSSGQRVRLDHRIVRDDGQVFVVQHFAESERDRDGDVRLYSTLLDVTERHRQAEQLKEAATHDSLTGALNRSGFRNLADRALAKCGRDQSAVSLLMLDADHFKKVNDRFGHDVGDRVLVTLAETIKDKLRPYDVFGRIGGEEFAILLPDTPALMAVSIAERLLDALRDQKIFLDNGEVVRFTVSCGVAAADSGEISGKVSVEALLKTADQALYEAKSAGRDQVKLSQADQLGSL